VKKQIILIGSGIILIVVIFMAGKTVADKKPVLPMMQSKTQSFDIQGFIEKEKTKLAPDQKILLSKLEENISINSDPTQKIASLTAVAIFWKDSIQQFESYAYFIAEAAKLDNSEKSLTFAAQLFLSNLRGEQDDSKLNWESNEAISLFEKAIMLNPSSENLKIDLASCYIYGKGRNGDPQQIMKGILSLLEIVRRDSTNMKAQLVLGIGGFVSGQYDKAVARLTKVITQEPNNLEAIAFLADTYAAQGNKEAAIKWYTISKRLINNASYSKEVDERIKTLQNK
jgi:tetratricopeptide (TPR) repeat protein